MRKICLKLSGGLGNQLWQLAYAYKVFIKYNYDVIEIDESYYQKHKIRSSELSNYELPNVTYKESSKRDNKYETLYFIFSKIRGLVFLMSHRYIDNRCKLFYEWGYVITHNHAVYIENAVKNDRLIISGYFQDVVNIADIIHFFGGILNISNLPEEVKQYKNIIRKSSTRIALSIRCGDDYAVLGKGICDHAYYKRALEYLEAFDKDVFVFSDDIEKAKDILSAFEEYSFVFIPQFSAVAQLELLRECKYHILSNSTFSYWGYLLSDCVCGVVPNKWFPYLRMEEAGLLQDNLVIV